MAQKKRNRKPQDASKIADGTGRVLAPLTRLSALGVRAFEHGARHGYEVAGDVLELTLAQMRAVSEARDPGNWVARQSGLAAAFFEQQTRRANDWFRLAAGVQDELGKWAADAANAAAAETRAAAQRTA